MEEIIPEFELVKLLANKSLGFALNEAKLINLLQFLDSAYRAGFTSHSPFFLFFYFKCILLLYLTFYISGRILREPMELDEEDFLGEYKLFYFCPFFFSVFNSFIFRH